MPTTDWIREYYATVDSMDMERYLAYHTDDVRFRFGSTPTTTGKEPVKEGLNHLWSALESMRHNMTGVWIVDNVAVVEADITYTRKDGKAVVLPAVTVLRVEGELINDVRVNMDISPLFAS